MKREFQVRFCERLEGETPSCLLSGKENSFFGTKTQGHKGSRSMLIETQTIQYRDNLKCTH
jgi:hypothetical protein